MVSLFIRYQFQISIYSYKIVVQEYNLQNRPLIMSVVYFEWCIHVIVFRQNLQASWEQENKSDIGLALVNANDIAALVANDLQDKDLYFAV